MGAKKIKQTRFVLRLEVLPGDSMDEADDWPSTLHNDVFACVDRLQKIFDCEKNSLAADAARVGLGSVLRSMEK